jgi:hypothetical protein
MSQYYPRRGRNWYSAMGVLFIVVGGIVVVRDVLIWSPDFVLDFLLSSEITNAKISLGMFVFGGILVVIGFRQKIV